MIRSLITAFMGHVDHGKTSLLDQIRGTSIAKTEPGAITQHISYTKISPSIIEKHCKNLLKDKKIVLPGLLFIDTPGHEAFTNLRSRGGNIADMAVLVININEGFKPQTIEALQILKEYKTPFIIAANKIDLLSGWRPSKDFILNTIEEIPDYTKQDLDKKLYEIVGRLSEFGVNAERFDKIDNYAKQVAIIPVSAKTGQGIPELLMTLTGLAQKFLGEKLNINKKNPGKATILEVKEEKGLGKALDIILYDGTIKENDKIILGTVNEPIITKVKSLFVPEKGKLKQVKFAEAAEGLKLSALNINEVVAGMPLIVANTEEEKIVKEIKKEIQEVLIETEKDGIIIKADTLGSLEALIKLIKEKNIPIKTASIGNVTKKDLAQASSESNFLNKVIIAFNVKANEIPKEVKVIKDNIIYSVLDKLLEYRENKTKSFEETSLKELTKPCKIEILKNHTFRKSNPAVVGIEVLLGNLTNTCPLTKDGSKLCKVKGIQSESKNIEKAEKGKQVAISLPGITIGRQINESDILYSDIPEEDFKSLKKLKDYLTEDEKQALKEIAELKRKNNSTWGL